MIPVPQAPSFRGLLPGCILASSGPCLLQKLIQDTALGRLDSFLSFFFFANDGYIVFAELQVPPASPGLLCPCSSPLPALSKDSELHRGRKHRASLSSAHWVLFSPESEKRQTGCEAARGGALPGAAWPLLGWLNLDWTLDPSPFCTAQTPWLCCQGRRLGRRAPKSGELGDASPLCPFSCRLTLGMCQGQRLSCLFDTFLHNLNLQVTSEQGTPCPHTQAL